MFKQVEEQIQSWVEWLRLLVETLGASMIAVGIVIAIIGLIRHAITERAEDFTDIRLRFARYLVLALEFQLAADILSTAITPTWESIGRLAAIAAIRTVLNYFLDREMKEERRREQSEKHRSPEDQVSGPRGKAQS